MDPTNFHRRPGDACPLWLADRACTGCRVRVRCGGSGQSRRPVSDRSHSHRSRDAPSSVTNLPAHGPAETSIAKSSSDHGRRPVGAHRDCKVTHYPAAWSSYSLLGATLCRHGLGVAGMASVISIMSRPFLWRRHHRLDDEDVAEALPKRRLERRGCLKDSSNNSSGS